MEGASRSCGASAAFISTASASASAPAPAPSTSATFGLGSVSIARKRRQTSIVTIAIHARHRCHIPLQPEAAHARPQPRCLQGLPILVWHDRVTLEIRRCGGFALVGGSGRIEVDARVDVGLFLGDFETGNECHAGHCCRWKASEWFGLFGGRLLCLLWLEEDCIYAHDTCLLISLPQTWTAANPTHCPVGTRPQSTIQPFRSLDKTQLGLAAASAASAASTLSRS